MANKRFVVRHGLDNSGDTSATNTIINVAEPVNNSDAATKYYVDTHATGGTVTAVTATSPVESTGGTTPVISLGTGTSGQLVIGTGTGFTKSTLTAGSGVSISNGSGTITISATGSGGDVTSPNPSTDNAVVRFDGTTGKVIQTSTVTLSDTGVLTVPEVSTTSITSTDNNAIVIAPDGAGHLNLQTDVVRIGDNAVDATLTTRSTGDLILTTHEGSATQGVIRLYDGANGNITLTPNGTGQVQVGSDQVVTLTASQTLTNKSLSGSSNTFTNIPNSATTATSSNTASAIVARDASGNFSAGTITATLSGNASNITASSNTTLTSLVNLATVGTITSGTWTAGTIGVSYGGTGLTTLTAGYIPYGNGTSAFGSSANLFWDSTNSRLGIGTTSPNYSIDINGAGVFGINNAYGLYTRIAGGTLKPFFATAGTNTHFYNTNASGSINWSNAADSSILMTLTDAGSLGLGTTSPASKLNVSGSNVTVSAGYGIAYSADQNRIMTPEDNVSGALISWGSGGICRFREGSSTERMRIDSSGNVRIANSSGNYGPLFVGNTALTSPVITIQGNTSCGIQFANATSGAGEYNGYIVYNHSSNHMAFATATTERMRIDSSGNLGIGTSSPAYKLHIATTGVNAFGVYRDLDVTSVGSAGQLIEIGARNGSTFTAGAAITGVLENPATTGFLSFSTRSSSALSERMRIDSSGNVGIGTTSPQARLHVLDKAKISDSSQGLGLLALGDGSSTVNNVGIWRGEANSVSVAGNWLGLGGYQGIVFTTSNTSLGSQSERMRIDVNGNVGIGTSTVVANFGGYKTLELNGTTGGLLSLDSNGTNNLQMYTNGSTVNVVTIGALPLTFGTNSTERMRIDSSGNVGIGTSSPSAKLDVNGQVRAAYASGFQVDNAGTMLGKLYYSGGLILDRAASTSLFIAQNGSNQVTLDSSGNLGLGTSSPSEKLTVTGNVKASGVLLGNNGSKGFGAVTTTTSTSTPTGGASGDHYYIY